MHLISQALSTIGTIITVALGAFVVVLWSALLFSRRGDKQDEIARDAQRKEQEQYQKEQEALRSRAKEQAFINEGIRQARIEEQRRAELRQMVREEVTAQIARQEPEPYISWRDTGRD